jgi:intracellular multiplication protein IcmE
MAETTKKRQTSPKSWQKTMIVVAIGAVAVGVYSMMGSSNPPIPTSNIKGVSADKVKAVVGDNQGSERYNQVVAEDNDEKAEIALQQGQTFFPTPEANSDDLSLIEEDINPAPVQAPKVQVAPVESQQQINNRNKVVAPPNPLYKQALAGFLTKWDAVQPEAQVTVYDPVIINPSSQVLSDNSTEGSSNSGSGLVVAPFSIGKIVYGVNTLLVNSDSPGPVVATVVSNDEQNLGKFTGGFTRQGERIVIEYTNYTDPNGVTYPVSAYAVDAKLSSSNVASDVDHHTFTRWAALVASSFAEGFGKAVEHSGVSSVSNGDTISETTPEYSVADQAWIAAGTIGERTSGIAERYFDRPPTVVLDSGEPIGILIMNNKL